MPQRAEQDKACPIREYITMKARILVVDDDEALAEMIGIVLRNDGFEPVFCADGGQALDVFRSSKPDLVLLDLMLPGTDGIEVCRQIRSESDVPIVMLTAKADTSDAVRGLESGADDYVPKPFKPAELVARVRARLRPVDQKAPETLRIADVTIDVAGHLVSRGDERISLTPLEFDLLVALARKPWQVFTRELLLEQVWGYRHAADTRLVNVHVQRLRSKIEQDPEVPGAYRRRNSRLPEAVLPCPDLAAAHPDRHPARCPAGSNRVPSVPAGASVYRACPAPAVAPVPAVPYRPHHPDARGHLVCGGWRVPVQPDRQQPVPGAADPGRVGDPLQRQAGPGH